MDACRQFPPRDHDHASRPIGDRIPDKLIPQEPAILSYESDGVQTREVPDMAHIPIEHGTVATLLEEIVEPALAGRSFGPYPESPVRQPPGLLFSPVRDDVGVSCDAHVVPLSLRSSQHGEWTHAVLVHS